MTQPDKPQSADARGLGIKSSAGFSILELMMVLGIIGALASIALPAYQDYAKRARMVEVTTFIGEIHTAIAAEHAGTGEFPIQLMDSQSRIAARQTRGVPRVSRADSRVSVPSELIDEYYYEYNPRRNFAYVAIRMNRDAVPDCRGRCMVHVAATEVDGQLKFFCGRWTRAYWRDPFPPTYLDRECDSDNINRELRRLRRNS